MAGKILGENVTFRIEVEDSPKSVLLVFDKKCDWAIVPWEDAFNLAKVMEQVVRDVQGEFQATTQEVTVAEQAQIQFSFDKGLVAMMVEWADRIRFSSLSAFVLVARAMRKVAQDSHLAGRGIRFQYDRQGMIKKLYNLKADTIQHVR